MQYMVILVDSTSHAIQLEKLLTAQKILCKLIPVPRYLSSDCGVCVRFPGEVRSVVEGLVAEKKIRIQSIEAL